MNSGAFGENFPYTNFHDLNLDWIIKTVKEFHDQYTNIETTIAEGNEQLESTIADGLEQMETAKNDAIREMTDLGNNFTRRYIFLGDSYGDRTRPDGQNYYQLLISFGVITSSNSYFKNIAGAGFVHPQTDHTFKYLLETLTVDNPETITDIIIECGANDNFRPFADIISALVTFYAYAHTRFPLARIQLFACGLTMKPDAIAQRADSVLQAFREASAYGFIFIPNSESILYNTTYLESDRCHPNSNGVMQIAWGLAQAIRMGQCVTRHRLYTGQLNAVATLTGTVTPASAVIGASYVSGLYEIATDNIIKIIPSFQMSVAFNLNNVTLTQASYIVISFDETAGLPTATELKYCTLHRNLDNTEQSYDVPASVTYGYDETTNKYTITIRPLGTFNTGANDNVCQIMFNDTIVM